MDPAPIACLLYPDVQTPDSSISLRGGVYNTPLGLTVICGGIWGGSGGKQLQVHACAQALFYTKATTPLPLKLP